MRDNERELLILDTITKCLIRYTISISDEKKDETQSEWFIECRNYLRERQDNVNAQRGGEQIVIDYTGCESEVDKIISTLKEQQFEIEILSKKAFTKGILKASEEIRLSMIDYALKNNIPLDTIQPFIDITINEQEKAGGK